MSTTTQILFNSPALHSLKRDQLVKLCKIHGIKANGKNVDLIERLKQHAQDIPANSNAATTSALNDSEDTDQDQDVEDDTPSRPLPRPSEQWEMVMEDIEEEEEGSNMGSMTSMKTLNQQGNAGEFGTSGSKSSVSTSLKALANSLGLKRALTKSSSNSKIPVPTELDKHAIPYSEIPATNPIPPTDISMAEADVSMDAPIPGGSDRPGIPAPANARLSTGEGLTTTVRLISSTSRDEFMSPPKLRPLQTAFDLIMSPGAGASGSKSNIWPPASPVPAGRLYPSLDEMMAIDQGTSTPNVKASPAPAFSAAKRASLAMQSDQPEDIFSPKKHIPATQASSTSTPFLFGSPLPASRPRTSNADFDKAAASVLSEMNKRLAESGVQSVDTTLLKKDFSSGDPFGGASNLAATRKRTDSTTDRFAKAHEKAFGQMDSIANHYAAKRGTASNTNLTATAVAAAGGPSASNKRKSDALGLGPAPGPSKRKSSAANARVISAGNRKKMIPGGFGDDDDEEEEEEEQEVEAAGDRRSSKRMRVTESSDVNKGRRVSLLVAVKGEDEGMTEEDKAREERKRQAMKRKLDDARARRRSSRGRVSVGGKVVPGENISHVSAGAGAHSLVVKPKASRFGFLSSAKSLVRNVWNMGAGGNGTAKAPSNIPVPKATIAPKPTPAPAPPTSKQSSLGLGKPSSSKNLTATRTSSNTTSGKASVLTADMTGTRNSSSSRARSPIPAFDPSSDDKHLTERNRVGSSASRIPSRGSAMNAFSSMGTRNSTTPGTSTTSSMGTKRSLVPPSTNGTASSSRLRVDSNDTSKLPTLPRRSSSTLMAPTASSLAKRQSAIRQMPRSPSTLQQITNSPQSPRQTPGKIFSTSLEGMGSPKAGSTPKPTFATMGVALMSPTGTAAATPSMGGPIPPKPKSLVGRKPRISRSRVIAKLGAQRAASSNNNALSPASTVMAGHTPNRAAKRTRPRSSMGAATARRSLGGAGIRNSHGGGGDLLRKKVRQSEIAARRKSRVAAGSAVGAGSSKMDVDD
ncbi:hypothetical protein EIP91_005862 [Steccherinum ochraceum]|uniref:SAP domain-containing protein n=1 Tax=Steccherinum ochraceum TaxID=92696 RepID=A0A4R0RCL0_9APHY|nr:hypothetical protein EIP91_005862 [Steccherinum ochraceum]